MIKEINKILNKLKRKLPDCYVKYGINTNMDLVDFYIYYDRKKKYIKITMIKEKIHKININLLVKEIKNKINKQYYGIESNIIIFDEFVGNHIPKIN